MSSEKRISRSLFLGRGASRISAPAAFVLASLDGQARGISNHQLLTTSDHDDIAIRVTNLSKSYYIYDRPEDRLKQSIIPRLQRLIGKSPCNYFHEFWALKDVSFEVKKGETVGIIGRNGSGKSTLLQLICGTLNPTSGRIETHGRIAALLELGSGFNPEFTGRENVFMNGAVLGLTREEIEARFDDIAAFADIGEFMEQPVRTYSSGMVVRLAFAVQAQIDPDILIVDEALAVGDARFQAKCFARLNDLRGRGTSILIVTHSTEQIVTHCDRALLLEQGQKAEEGRPRPVVNRYLDLLYGRPIQQNGATVICGDISSGQSLHASISDEQLLAADPEFASRTEPLFMTRPAYNPHEYRWGDRRGEIMDFLLIADGTTFPSTIISGATIVLYVRYRYFDEIARPIHGFTLKTKEGVTVYGTNTEMGGVSEKVPNGRPGQSLIVRFESVIPCGAGDYFLSVGLASRDMNGDVIPHDRRYDAIHLHVTQGQDFVGLVNFSAKLKIYT